MQSRLHSTATALHAGAATSDITPQDRVFLYGYPHVPRLSTGVHDRLESAALYLRQEGQAVLFIANDLIFVSRQLSGDVRRRISIKTGVPAEAIAITATHTHSGPVTVDGLSHHADPVVPKADPSYLQWVADSMVEAGCAAIRSAQPAEAGLVVAQAEGVGTNRHDPAGPADRSVPVLVVRALADQRPIACMLAYAMHTTVLHEDSTLISGDFPHFTRQYLRRHGLVPEHCPVLYHNGASGNQSPRHVTKANTFAEAQRLGELLGAAVADAMRRIAFHRSCPLRVRRAHVPLQLRVLPAVAQAEAQAKAALEKFRSLRTAQAPRTAVRTAECDWFGAEETVALAQAALDGRLQAAANQCSPAEIQVFELGTWKFVFWPGEFFVEYALEVKGLSPNTFVITMANGELQGYIVTPEAVARGTYEATNAVFGADNGRRVVAATLGLLAAQD
ncbi:neutral/alkaline non-lysosomal ceramidase N-terminal domain-containing protein [Opitutus sp. GAS368]|uniref:neutral/alkaline non-lysosomal ceramidase N-terminal domain-containing protein n=1 Tax=Opitutus sp. GAS368 TaxID=1882749 RepID=UPI000879B9A1|nr:neutral/alkaline non-lysosomal ceramidase N-terminal domain-containing protein [Opitutus sp. GAS368]SDS48592.1 Neutral/alkaline non-lysosomal ceramidase, N-terminal [Opitutus sp. GAS368]